MFLFAQNIARTALHSYKKNENDSTGVAFAGEASTPAKKKTPWKKAPGVKSPPPQQKATMMEKFVKFQEMSGDMASPTRMFNDNPEFFGAPNTPERGDWTSVWRNNLGKGKSVTKYFVNHLKNNKKIKPHPNMLDVMATEQLSKVTGTAPDESRSTTQDFDNVFDAVGGNRDDVDEEDIAESLAAMRIHDPPEPKTGMFNCAWCATIICFKTLNQFVSQCNKSLQQSMTT
eukprot:CAMPEP_0113653250 /NCGR_PEP_ID=MMETSP0017_2-20120614/28474_1 /TAXON_ID=2856 /ORGANISM="Cylindrotheca closterium" /LENGTH=229 /DNA_ID=CAMNT_0000566221 /DNA_START=179 /DNA_END=864 /DNA_ORIENTATION=+ /assembly_acc=CAM_ASM_000147